MKTCVKCGKKGLFLWLSKSGYCEDCARKVLAERKLAAEKAAAEQRAAAEAYAKRDMIDRPQSTSPAATPATPDTVPACSAASHDSAHEMPTTSDDAVRTLYIPARMNNLPLAYKYDDVGLFTFDKLPDADFDLLGEQLDFKQEPENQYDSDAVAAYCRDVKVGYLYRGTLQDMANDFITAELPVVGYITTIDDEENKVKICLTFYKVKHGKRTKEFTLTGGGGSEAQEMLSLTSEDETVDIEYDYDKDKYRAECGGFIGYFPASANDLLEDYGDAYVSSVYTDDNDKYHAKVTVTY